MYSSCTSESYKFARVKVAQKSLTQFVNHLIAARALNQSSFASFIWNFVCSSLTVGCLDFFFLFFLFLWSWLKQILLFVYGIPFFSWNIWCWSYRGKPAGNLWWKLLQIHSWRNRRNLKTGMLVTYIKVNHLFFGLMLYVRSFSFPFLNFL